MIMDLTFQEAARGANKEININVKETCPKCAGTKAEPGTKPSKCHHCNGTGMVSRWLLQAKGDVCSSFYFFYFF